MQSVPKDLEQGIYISTVVVTVDGEDIIRALKLIWTCCMAVRVERAVECGDKHSLPYPARRYDLAPGTVVRGRPYFVATAYVARSLEIVGVPRK